jgi:hypothetical protein
MKTIACLTLGCKVNQYDTEAMREAFEKAGYLSVPFGARRMCTSSTPAPSPAPATRSP